MRDVVTWNAATPDAHDIVEDMATEGDRVVVRWTRRGTRLAT
jgi:hypothetical protein